MRRKGYSILEMIIILLILGIFTIVILDANKIIIINKKRTIIKDFQINICRSIIEFYKVDSGNFKPRYELYFSDFDSIKDAISKHGLSSYLNNVLNNKLSGDGNYKLILEFQSIENLNSIRVICEKCDDNIKTMLLYYK